MSIPAWLWATWLIGVIASFGVLEGIALANRKGYDTLTANLRRWCGIFPVRPWRRVTIPVFAATLIVFVGWFVPHIVAGWWGGSGTS